MAVAPYVDTALESRLHVVVRKKVEICASSISRACAHGNDHIMARRTPVKKILEAEAFYQSLPSLPLAPEEQPEHRQVLEQAILSELAPATAYETLLARDLIDIERSIQIYRRRQASLHLTAARNMLWDELVHRQDDPQIAQLGEPGAFSAGWAYGSSEDRFTAAEQLAAIGVHEADIVNAAHQQTAPLLMDLTRVSAQLEQRRRNLLQDFRNLKAQRPHDAVPLVQLQA